jgi:Acyl-CoA thioesterase C-terminal domain/Acyl-CoA thioesterase N-terminal domain
MPASAFVRAGEARWRATELTRGPWDPGHQHAGPPSALVARQVLAAAAPMGLSHLARLTMNLLRPIPVAELAVAVQTDYAGRNAAHFSYSIVAQAKEVARGTALVQRESPLALPEGLPGHPLPKAPRPPGDSSPGRFPFHSDADIGYSQLVEARVAAGEMFRGPCAVWFRLRHPIVAGEAPLPAERVAVAADSGNGISAILDFRKFLFLNSDLTINLLRQARGEWVCLEARTLFGPDASGLAESRIYDAEGLIGRGTQSLVVRPR